MYTITTREHDFSGPILTWNRRKGEWQAYDSRACLYKTRKGAARIAVDLSRRNMGMTMTIVPYVE